MGFPLALPGPPLPLMGGLPLIGGLPLNPLIGGLLPLKPPRLPLNPPRLPLNPLLPLNPPLLPLKPLLGLFLLSSLRLLCKSSNFFLSSSSNLSWNPSVGLAGLSKVNLTSNLGKRR